MEKLLQALESIMVNKKKIEKKKKKDSVLFFICHTVPIKDSQESINISNLKHMQLFFY